MKHPNGLTVAKVEAGLYTFNIPNYSQGEIRKIKEGSNEGQWLTRVFKSGWYRHFLTKRDAVSYLSTLKNNNRGINHET